MALRVSVAVLVVALVAGSLLFSFSGTAAKMGDSSAQMVAKDESQAPGASPKFNLPAGGKEGGKPAEEVKIDFASIPPVIAEVNGVKIKNDMLVRALKGLEHTVKAMGQPLTKEKLDQVKNSIVENIISAEALSQQAMKEGIKIEDSAVNEHLAMMKKRFPDEATFKKVMESQGLDENSLKTELTLNLRIRALLDKNVVNKITVSEDAAKKYYETHQLEFERREQVRASHILAKIDTSGDEAAKKASKEKARKKIEAALKKIQGGADFAEVAKAESEDPGSAANGGDLGLFSRGQMVPEFEKAAFDLAPGKISGVVESNFGFHIIKLVEKRPGGKVAFDEAKTAIEGRIKNEEANSKIMEYITTLKKSMAIKKLI